MSVKWNKKAQICIRVLLVEAIVTSSSRGLIIFDGMFQEVLRDKFSDTTDTRRGSGPIQTINCLSLLFYDFLARESASRRLLGCSGEG